MLFFKKNFMFGLLLGRESVAARTPLVRRAISLFPET